MNVCSIKINQQVTLMFDPINVTFGLFGAFLVYMALDQYLIFLHHTSIDELIKKLYNWLAK